MIRLLIAILFCLIAANVFAGNKADDEVDFLVPSTFVTGNQWLGMDNNKQVLYVMGVVDGMNIAHAVNNKSKNEKEIYFFKCNVVGMTGGQIRAIIKKYMDENPDKWHWPMPVMISSAIDESCSN